MCLGAAEENGDAGMGVLAGKCTIGEKSHALRPGPASPRTCRRGGRCGLLASAQPGQHRRNPSVSRVLVGQPELGEDRVDVLLDRREAQVQVGCYRGVGASRGHPLQHAALALGEVRQRRRRRGPSRTRDSTTSGCR